MTRRQAKNAFRGHIEPQGFRVRARRRGGMCCILVTDRKLRWTLTLSKAPTWLKAYWGALATMGAEA